MAKPSSTGLQIEKIYEAYRKMGKSSVLFERLQMTYLLTDLYADGELSDIELIVADMFNYSFGLDNETVSVDHINEMMALREDVQCISVPYWYIKALTEGFKSHANREVRVSLGKAMNLEGDGRGSRRKIDNIVDTIRDLQLCEIVLALRAKCEHSGDPISLEDAYAEVSSFSERKNFKASVDVIRRAFKRYGARVQAAKTKLLIGGATS
jgi:hypothetical protein